jgi:hypothetical protein
MIFQTVLYLRYKIFTNHDKRKARLFQTPRDRAPEVIRAWLNSVHPDLGMSPLDAILANKAEAVETMLENAIAGIPS